MSLSGQRIVCRNCKETISTEEGNCPHCGASIRSNWAYIAGIVFGLLLMGATVFNPGDLLFYGVIGLLIAGSAAYLLYEKRQRIHRATERASTEQTSTERT